MFGELRKNPSPSGARIFPEFSKHLHVIYHVFVVSSLIYYEISNKKLHMDVHYLTDLN